MLCLVAHRVAAVLPLLVLITVMCAVAYPALAATPAAAPSTDPVTTYTFPDCVAGPLAGYPICDPSLDPVTRATSLVGMLKTDEKISRMGNTGAAVDRIGLPAYQWWSEALHGVAHVTWADAGLPFSNASSFPSPIGLGAAFDDELVHAVASTISTEARAFGNAGRAGLDFWTPNINPFRDPRWGRGQETPGEDPYHISRYVYQLVHGLQEGEDPRYYKIVADCKHFAGYDLENWNGNNRRAFNAIIAQNDLVEFYLPSFESCVRDAHVGSIMCSYNAVNGVPSCANKHFIEDIARGQWSLDGWVTGDCGGVQCIYANHNYTSTPQGAVAAALNAGVDIDCGSYMAKYASKALSSHLINETQIDTALIRQFTSLVRVGYFDDPNTQPYRQYSIANVTTPAAQQLARTAALKSFVLLKNVNQTLPIAVGARKATTTVALIGPLANGSYSLVGNYAGKPPYIVTPLSGVREYVPSGVTVLYAYGCSVNETSTEGFAEALSVAAAADMVVYVGGITVDVEAEEHDRMNITWPGVQLELIQMLAAVGKPLTVVVTGGGQVDSTVLRDSDAVGAMLWVGYPGMEAGNAIAEVLFGAYSPAGRLPVTQYPGEYVNQVPMTDMSLRESATNPGRTYKFYTGEAVFPFGYGLSYTTFAYEWANESAVASMDLEHTVKRKAEQGRPAFNIQQLMKTLVESNPVDGDRAVFTSYSVNVTNTGATVTSDVVVLGFLSNQAEAVKEQAPISELYAYDRVHALAPGESRTVEFYVTMRQVSVADATTGDRWVYPGVIRMFIDVEQAIVHEFELVGEPALLVTFPKSQQKQSSPNEIVLAVD